MSSEDASGLLPAVTAKQGCCGSRHFFYTLDPAHQRSLLRMEPPAWATEPRFFQRVYLDISAAMKLTSHAVRGGDIEVMGMLVGKFDVERRCFVITDSFPLPVEATETRVNAHEEAYEHLVRHMGLIEKAGKGDAVIGWYHSHPGYGCWLSGIDVATQELQQSQGPYVAVVVDPKRTMADGRLEIGAFRTLPAVAAAASSSASSSPKQPLARSLTGAPTEKLKEYGMHAHRFYELPIELVSSEEEEAVSSHVARQTLTSLAFRDRRREGDTTEARQFNSLYNWMLYAMLSGRATDMPPSAILREIAREEGQNDSVPSTAAPPP